MHYPTDVRRTFRVLSLSFLLLSTAMAGLLAAQGRQESKRAYNFDRRAARGLRSLPHPSQQEAIAALRKELGGSLYATYDEASGVTRGLYNPVGTLTEPAPGQPVDIALDFVQSNLSLLGLEPGDLDEMEICDVVTSNGSGATHVYLCQVHQGLRIYNAQLQVHVDSDGAILGVNNGFVPGLRSKRRPAAAAIGGHDASMAAASHLGVEPKQGGVIRAADLSTEPIDAKLMWLPEGRNLTLVWRFQVHTPDGQHVYDMTVSAEEGPDPSDQSRVMTRYDWVTPGLYQVYERPAESPNHASPAPPDDGRTVAMNPEDPFASPLGWHDTGSASYTTMRGNNVHAYDDRNADDQPPAVEPDCGPGLECTFPLDLTQDPSTYTSAAVANLFYWTNLVHDIQWHYGFDEASGNFQVNNFGRGGLGGDDVKAEAQDGSGFDNANFTVAPDGTRPKIQMFLWDLTNPYLDGDFDAGIIVHEYGHGISTRLVGGPSNVSCLSNYQQPGEGLSDWWSLVYTARPGDLATDRRTIGTYVLGEPTDGYGIRTQPYTTDSSLNTHTYESIAGMAIPHGVGEVWAQAAWEVYWALVGAYGYDPDLANAAGGAGNQRMMLYVNEGLKNTACSPTFTDVRDGIIQAAIDNYGGEDVCRLWDAFANFGLGIDAVSGDPWSTTPTNGFQVPASCLVGPRIENPVARSQLTSSTVTFEWTADGEAVTRWRLEIGTTQGGADVYDSGELDGSILSAVVTGIPKNGAELHARLSFEIGGSWDFKDHLYTAPLGTPEITAPTPGSVLTGSEATFEWIADDAPVLNWILRVGSTPGASNLFSSPVLSADTLSVTATGLPTDSRTLYVRLQYKIGLEWFGVDYTYTAADLSPELLTPAPGSVFPGTTETFTWTSNGAPVANWLLYVGVRVGASNYFNSGLLSSDVTSATATRIPTDGSTVYVRLVYLLNGEWLYKDYEYTAADLQPELVAPVPGSELPGSQVNFGWTSNGAAVSNWILRVGTSTGYSNLFYSGTLSQDTLSMLVSNLPADGSTIYVRLQYSINGTWTALDYQYQAAPPIPEMLSPIPGSQLPGTSVTFSWASNGASVSDWQLAIGTGVGGADLYDSGLLAASTLSVVATGLPSNELPLYVRLSYHVGGALSFRDYVYTAARTTPEITSPTPGSVLPSTTVPFTWTTNGLAVTEFVLSVGSSAGANDLYASGPLGGSVLGQTVSGLPADGRLVYVRLEFVIDGVRDAKDFVYTGDTAQPEVVDPTPGSTLSGASATFTWTSDGAPVTSWILRVGTTLGGSNLFYSGVQSANVLTASVSNLPTDSRTIYVRLQYNINGTWYYTDHTYTAADLTPELLTPTPGTVMSGAEASFTWTSNGAAISGWILRVGSSLGGSNYYYSGTLSASTLSATATNLPTDGRTLYVRLQYLVNGLWTALDYQYTAATILPELVSPTPGSVLKGSTVTFSWISNGVPVSYWILRVGSSPGGTQYHYSSTMSATTLSRTVSNLPTNGETIYVRLQYYVNGSWKYLDYQFTGGPS